MWSVIDVYFNALQTSLRKTQPKCNLFPEGPSYGQLVVLPVVDVALQLDHLLLQMFTYPANASNSFNFSRMFNSTSPKV